MSKEPQREPDLEGAGNHGDELQAGDTEQCPAPAQAGTQLMVQGCAAFGHRAGTHQRTQHVEKALEYGSVTQRQYRQCRHWQTQNESQDEAAILQSGSFEVHEQE